MSDDNVYESVGIAVLLAALIGLPMYLVTEAYAPEQSTTIALFWAVFAIGLVLWAFGRGIDG